MFSSVTLLSHPCVLRDLIDRFSILFLEDVFMISSFTYFCIISSSHFLDIFGNLKSEVF